MEEVTTEEYSFQKDDPEYLLSFVNKYVEVELIQNISFKGFVRCIDPFTHSVILSVPKEDDFQPTVLPGHAIKDIYELPTPNVQPPSHILSEPETEYNIASRKAKLIAWFKFNLLPVSEFEDRILLMSADVLPPYNAHDIYAVDPAIALKYRKIMERMPEDFIAT